MLKKKEEDQGNEEYLYKTSKFPLNELVILFLPGKIQCGLPLIGVKQGILF